MSTPDRLRISLVQANPVAGDITGNLAQAQAALTAGEASGADLVVLPAMLSYCSVAEKSESEPLKAVSPPSSVPSA